MDLTIGVYVQYFDLLSVRHLVKMIFLFPHELVDVEKGGWLLVDPACLNLQTNFALYTI